MHITRRTNEELVVADSSVWLSAVFLALAAFTAYQAVALKVPNWWLCSAFLSLFAFAFWRRETVTFNVASQQVQWVRRRAFKLASGTLPFSEMRGITIETMNDTHNVPSCRLTILTTGDPIPMSDGYAGGQVYYEKLRKQILEFLNMDKTASPGPGDEESIRALLQQGRKVDAIAFMRTNYQLDLTEAVDRVNEIDEEMRAAAI